MSSQTYEVDPNLYTYPFQLTPTLHRSPYPFLSPSSPANSAAAEGKIILITGGGTGIGAAAAKTWTQAGASGIVLVGRRPNLLEDISSELRSVNGKVQVLVVKADISLPDETEIVFVKTKEEFGRTADIVLANAGVFLSSQERIGEGHPEVFWKHYVCSRPLPNSLITSCLAVR